MAGAQALEFRQCTPGKGTQAARKVLFFFFSSRRRHTRWTGDWISDVCSSDLDRGGERRAVPGQQLVGDGAAEAECPDESRDDRQRELVAAVAVATGVQVQVADVQMRSEERRVGKECESGGAACDDKKEWTELG